MKRGIAGGLLALSLALFGCDGDDNGPGEPMSAPPTPTAIAGGAATKPELDWGYPEYSVYEDGKHVGTTVYQQDATCIERLTFYTCAFIDAETPKNSMTNPTMASTAMTGGLDSCTAAIEDVAPSYCVP